MEVVAIRGSPLVILAVVLVVLGANLTGVVGIVGTVSAAPTTLYVDDGAAPSDPFCAPDTENFTRYQDVPTAVTNAKEGDTITICDGTYGEPIVVNKRLTIVGAGGVLDYGGSRGWAIFVEIGSDGTIIENLTIQNTDIGVFIRGVTDATVANVSFEGIKGSAVKLSNADGATIREINVRNSTRGIVAESSSDLTVDSGTFEVLEGSGVDLQNTEGTTVNGITVRRTLSGVSIRSSASVTVADSMFEAIEERAINLQNTQTAAVRGVHVSNSSTAVMVTATRGNVVSDVEVEQVVLRNLTKGVQVNVSGGATLSELRLLHLDISGTTHGVRLSSAGRDSTLTDVTVSDSDIVGSSGHGVQMSTTDDNALLQSFLLRNLTVDGMGTGEGIGLTVQQGVTRDITLRGSSIQSNAIGMAIRSNSLLDNVTVFETRIIGSEQGILVDGGNPGSFAAVGIHGNLIAGSNDVGVLVTDGTDPRRINVTRNVLRDNAFGVRNEGTGVLTAWLNYWGDDSGPSTQRGVIDPVSLVPANGDGNAVSGNIHFDPWIGKGACAEPGVRSVVDGPFELYDVSVGRSESQFICAWDLAPLTLRPDPGDAAMSIENLNLSYDLPGTNGPVSADRPNVSIYEAGEAFDLRFGAGSTDASAFAGTDTQLIVIRDPISTDPSFDIGFDSVTDATVLRNDAESVSVRKDWGTIDETGRLSGSFTPSVSGSYTFVLVRPDFGPGVKNSSEQRVVRVDGGITVLGFETVAVREMNADASAMSVDTSSAGYPAGSEIPFDLSSNLAGTTDHAVLLYNESLFHNATATVRVDATATAVLAGELDSASDVSVESSVPALNGFYRATGGFSTLGVDVPAGDDTGLVNPSPVVGQGMRLYDTSTANWMDTPGATPLPGSIFVVESSGPAATVDIETSQEFPAGTYRYVYVARGGNVTSSATGRVVLTTALSDTPTSTLTPTPAGEGGGGSGGGSGGGGQAADRADGEVEVEVAELLNTTVTIDEPAVVRVDLYNPDPAAGFITLALYADGTTVANETVRVPASSGRTVSLKATVQIPGTYDLVLDGRVLGSLTVTSGPETPTRAPSPGATTNASIGGSSTGTPSTKGEVMNPGADEPLTTPGPDASSLTGTETVVAMGMALLLLYGVGVAVYVLRERPPSTFR